ncbi:MAG TPA: ABC transporter permease [Prolixibacteraceae bacterium]|jgi:ABC-2 type transport system permease protein
MRLSNIWSNILSGFDLTWFSFVDELKTIFKDKGAMLILFFAVFTYPLVYSIAYKNNVVRDIPVSVVDLDNTASSRQMIRMLGATKEVSVDQEVGSLHEARQLFWDGNSKGVILIPEGFEKKLLRGFQTSVSVYCDASYFLIYKETLSAVIQATGTLSAGVEIKRLMAAGSGEEQAMQQRDPMPAKFYNLYNPAGSYGSYVMPGMILIILQQTLLIGIGMIGGAGKERRNNQQVKPGVRVRQGMFSVVFGKGLAYFTIYLANIAFTLVYLSKWFGFPDKGSFADVCILLVPYLFSVIFLGLTISMLFRRREHSIMTLVFVSPIVLFVSGLSWPESSIPRLLYQLSHIFPSTSMIPAFLRIRTMGVSIIDVRPELAFLMIQMIVYFLLAAFTYKISVIRQERLHRARIAAQLVVDNQIDE